MTLPADSAEPWRLTENEQWALCLDFDLAMTDFWQWVEARKHETEMVPAPKRSKNESPKVPKPKYDTLSDLLALDAIDADDENADGGDAIDTEDALALWRQDPEAFLARFGGELADE